MDPPRPARFHVHTAPDFEEVKRHVSNSLSCEGNRCAFLRSASFKRFRMRCLYRSGRVSVSPPHDLCWVADGRLVLELERESPRSRGGWVTVVTAPECAMPTGYDDTWNEEQEDDEANQDASAQSVKNV